MGQSIRKPGSLQAEAQLSLGAVAVNNSVGATGLPSARQTCIGTAACGRGGLGVIARRTQPRGHLDGRPTLLP